MSPIEMLRSLVENAAMLFAIGVGVLLGMFVLSGVVRTLLSICAPSEIVIISGGKRALADGREVNYRIVRGGRAWRWPIIEQVDRMDTSLISVPMAMQGAYSEGGIPLAVHAIANVKVSSDRAVVGNAIERFLGRSREEIARNVKETLEGHLRGVIATMTPEEVNEDRLKFAERLTDEAGPDLRKLGLQLDTLKIQSVTDDRQYLDSIGRARIAEIVRTAEVAESDAVRSAEEAEAAATARGTVAKTRAHASVQRKVNERRELQAELEAEAKSEEVRAEQAAAAARAAAEQRLQQLRAELEALRLQADVRIPAETERRVRELVAEGEAYQITARGEAFAGSLRAIEAAWRECGGNAMDMVVAQQLETIFKESAEAVRASHPNEVNVLDSGDGSAIAGYVNAYPTAVADLVDRVADTFGIDLDRVLSGGKR
ncbi:MAG: SPFH domain-containing protein [Polyangiales bacterium]